MKNNALKNIKNIPNIIFKNEGLPSSNLQLNSVVGFLYFSCGIFSKTNLLHRKFNFAMIENQ